MRVCCPHLLPDTKERLLRPEFEDHFLQFAAHAEKIVSQVEPASDRRILELRFGLDQSGEPRTPAEVGEILGCKPQEVLNKIRKLMKHLPLVPEDDHALDVLYEDDDLIAVNKPPLMRLTPWHRFAGGSLMNMVAGRLAKSGGRPFAVHIIDTTTSGIVMVAKSSHIAATLNGSWHESAVRKHYLAIAKSVGLQNADEHVSPVPGCNGGAWEVCAPLAEEGSHRMIVSPEGKPATTRFDILDRSADCALLKCELVRFGRSHQIRVHAAHSGVPLLGDPWYGTDKDPSSINRTALHAWRLQLTHPVTKTQINLEAQIPSDFNHCLSACSLTMS